MHLDPKIPLETADASRGEQGFPIFLRNSVVVIVSLLFFFFLLGVSSDFIAGNIPWSWEKKLANLGLFSDSKTKTPENLQGIFNQLIAKLEQPETYKIDIIPLPSPNAFALPGRQIIVTNSLLKTLKKKESIQFVLAHELGHLAYRHSLRRMSRQIIWGLASSMLFGDNSSLTLFQTSEQLLLLNFSRDQEEEADRYALKMLQELDGDWNHLEEVREIFDPKVSTTWTMFSTHPHPAERLKAIEKFIESQK